MQRTTIYLDDIELSDDSGTIQCTVKDKRGNEVEVIACAPKFVASLKKAQKFWEDFQRRRAEADAKAHIESLSKRRSRAV